MRARTVIPLVVMALAHTAVAGDPKPTVVDLKPFRAKLLVLEDTVGGVYVVLPDGRDTRVWYGTGKTLYEQMSEGGYSTNGPSWDATFWAPRIPNIQPASIQLKEDGSYHKWCGSDSDTPLKPVTADRVKMLLDKSTIMSPIAIRIAYMLARDDSGIYYYVDKIRDKLGGQGYRVFVGKKGAMKQLPLSDLASDVAGDVFATKTGEVRFVRGVAGDKSTAMWVQGSNKTQLSLLDIDASSRLIFKDLGIYQFLGTLCDDI
jgi:hypothetical protein